jgi:uncharacterized protein (DUF1330 family)
LFVLLYKRKQDEQKNNTKIFFYKVNCSFADWLHSLMSSQNMGLGYEIDAGKLANEYASDIKAGNKKYAGKYLTVVGKIAQQYKNKYQESIIILMDSKNLNGVKCILNSSSKQLKYPFKQGELIKINGRCAGFDDYVLLKGCIILKN